MLFEDEPDPGENLPILPGHVSPGRFERVLQIPMRSMRELLTLMAMSTPSMRLMVLALIAICPAWVCAPC